MNLRELVAEIEIKNSKEIPNISIQSLAYDSRQVNAGALFVAIRGLVTDGHRYIEEALDRGAVAIMVEEGSQESGVRSQKREGVPFLVVPNSRSAMAGISAKFFGDPTRDLTVIGVTGTNGKTTITYLVEAILRGAGRSPSVLGTINYRHGEKIFPASHTTPESSDLQKFIAERKKEGADSVVMEVSSHALDLHRVDGIHYDVCVFTNLTPEHLDYHKNLEDYFRAKRRLFEELLPRSLKKNRLALINADDPFAVTLAEKIPSLKFLSFSLDPKKRAKVFPLSSRISLDGIEAVIQSPWGKMELKSPLLGAFNLSNLLAAIGAAGALGIDLKTMEEALRGFTSVPGRLERVPNEKGIHVFVDYAHTPDALKNVLGALKDLLKGESESRILVVFGCGGDRDKSKRPPMGEEVARGADWAVVTSDNPRTEDPRAILEQILPGLQSQNWREGKDFIVESDRTLAIGKAMNAAQTGDVVLIAGKGHEDYQILGKTKIHFDDREVAKKILAQMA